MTQTHLWSYLQLLAYHHFGFLDLLVGKTVMFICIDLPLSHTHDLVLFLKLETV